MQYLLKLLINLFCVMICSIICGCSDIVGGGSNLIVPVDGPKHSVCDNINSELPSKIDDVVLLLKRLDNSNPRDLYCASINFNNLYPGKRYIHKATMIAPSLIFPIAKSFIYNDDDGFVEMIGNEITYSNSDAMNLYSMLLNSWNGGGNCRRETVDVVRRSFLVNLTSDSVLTCKPLVEMLTVRSEPLLLHKY